MRAWELVLLCGTALTCLLLGALVAVIAVRSSLNDVFRNRK